MKLLKSRFNYWNCSKIANYIRGENKPYALEWGEWDKWHKEQKSKRPIRYWLSEVLLKKIQDIVYFPVDLLYTFRIYIRNRFVDKLQYLKTGLPPGEYYDLDYRILHGLFNELVDFVEKELSHLSKWDQNVKYNFHNGRCVEAAYDYFKWANNLKHKGRLTDQAKSSRKIKELYEWWTIKRPKRKSNFDEKYDQEDTEMLIELIKIRKHLWT